MGQVLVVVVEHLTHWMMASPSLESDIAVGPVAVAAVVLHSQVVHSKNLSAVLTTTVHQPYLAVSDLALEQSPMVCCCSQVR